MPRWKRTGAQRDMKGKATDHQESGDAPQLRHSEENGGPAATHQSRVDDGRRGASRREPINTNAASIHQASNNGSLHGAQIQPGGIAFVADVQYGDSKNHVNLNDNVEKLRFYSQTLCTFSRSATRARKLGSSTLVLLGDQVDDRDRNGDAAAATVLGCAAKEFRGCPIGYLLGNHDTKWTQFFRTARKTSPVAELSGHLVWECTAQTEDGSPPWRLIALDCYAEAFASKPAWGEQLPQDGGIGGAQLRWLRRRLQAASDDGQHVVILSHVPLNPSNDLRREVTSQHRKPTRTLCVPDYQLVQGLLSEAGCVRLCLAGHDHLGAYHLDTETGIHYVTLPACLAVSGPPVLSGAVLKLYRDRAVLTMLSDGAEIEVMCGSSLARVQGAVNDQIQASVIDSAEADACVPGDTSNDHAVLHAAACAESASGSLLTSVGSPADQSVHTSGAMPQAGQSEST